MTELRSKVPLSGHTNYFKKRSPSFYKWANLRSDPVKFDDISSSELYHYHYISFRTLKVHFQKVLYTSYGEGHSKVTLSVWVRFWKGRSGQFLRNFLLTKFLADERISKKVKKVIVDLMEVHMCVCPGAESIDEVDWDHACYQVLIEM